MTTPFYTIRNIEDYKENTDMNSKNKNKNINTTTRELIEAIDIRRQQNGLTWKDLCNLAGVNKNTVTLARDRNDIKYKTLCMLSNALGYGVQFKLVSADKILNGDDNE